VPPAPLHESVKVEFVVSVPVDCVPEVPLLPVHEPLAVQDVAFVEDQVSVELPPEVIDVGEAEIVTVGAGVVGVVGVVGLPETGGAGIIVVPVIA
jgi:hypothetical protein